MNGLFIESETLLRWTPTNLEGWKSNLDGKCLFNPKAIHGKII